MFNNDIKYIEGLQKEVENATNCERIQTLVDEHVKTVTDAITAKTQAIADIASQWAPLLSLPTDPMKILKWASKVVAGPIGAQVSAMAQMAVELAQLAAALAGLAAACAKAVQKLQQCIEDALLGALDTITNTLVDEAAGLLAQAESIKDQLIQDALDSTGISEVTDAVDGVLADVSTIEGSLDSIENSVDSLPEL